MTDAKRALIGFLVVVSVSFGAGFFLNDYLCSREHVEPVAHPEERTAPHDVALKTDPKAKSPLPAPAKIRGGKVVSTTEVAVSGGVPVRVTPPTAECLTAADFTCPGALLRLDLIQTDDGQQYMAVRGSDDREITGRYIPMSDVTMPPNKRLTLVGNPRGDVVATLAKGGRRWSWAASAGYIDQSPWAAAGLGFSWR